MKMFKKKDGDPKKLKAAVKKTSKSATKEGASEAMQSMSSSKPRPVATLKRIVKDVPMKRVPVSTLTRSVKTVMKPTATATIQRSTVNSKTGAVTKSAPKKMEMKSISAKEFNK